ncbi:multiubiquitin domain-containing protein [Rhizobium sp. GCM10022189]|uniref:multiubiquitin domain-containing protein n=1 Tax=Rhizobium sp. GCM10022189 TaxID=3252654 RepID=UPI0036131319
MSDTSRYEFSVNDHVYATSDQQLTGRDIRAAASLAPASDYVLIEIGNGTSRSVGLEEIIALRPAPLAAVFQAFRNDRSYSLTVNERGFEWGDRDISASDLRKFASIPDDHDIFLDSDADAPIGDDDIVHLDRKGVERIVSRPKPKVRILVNTREKFVSAGRISFSELVKLAFPDIPVGPTTSFTVSYRKGPADKPEGTLIEGESVKVKNGMVFNVSATDKS